MTDGVEIVVGTYEEFLVGYKVKKNGNGIELLHSFATHAHSGSVKCVVTSGRLLFSGGADDKIVVHDMNSRKENCVLVHHDGTVHAVAATSDNSHVLSGGSDGSLYAIRTGNWMVEKHWPKAHKGSPVTHISIHPSNKLALTLGDDHTLRTWNLVKGRQAYATNLKAKGTANATAVAWSPDGTQFALTGYNDVSVWSVESAAVKRVLKCPSKSTCLVWIDESNVVIGLENGEVALFDFDQNEKHIFKCHPQRLKGLAYLDGHLYTASSAGDIKVWKLKLQKKKLIEKASVNTDCRITGLTLVNPENLMKIEKRDEEAAESDVESATDDLVITNGTPDADELPKKKKRIDTGDTNENDQWNVSNENLNSSAKNDSSPVNIETKKLKNSQSAFVSVTYEKKITKRHKKGKPKIEKKKIDYKKKRERRQQNTNKGKKIKVKST